MELCLWGVGEASGVFRDRGVSNLHTADSIAWSILKARVLKSVLGTNSAPSLVVL